MKLFISTLGVFDAKLGETSLIKDSSRSYSLYKLLQYFITFKNKKILADTIIENIWADHESYDPYNMLRAQIYRLRQLIKKSLPEGVDEKLYMCINFSNGYYSLDIGEKVIIDIYEFERLAALGDDNIIDNPNASIEYYENALNLYKGAYLEENPYELWLVPIRNFYNTLYVKTLFKLLEILHYQEDYRKVIKVGQNAIVYKRENENLHIQVMEAMLMLGRIKDAQNHYQYTTFLLDKNIITNPSLALQKTGTKIQSYLIEKGNTNITNIKKKLEEESEQGPLQCEFSYFKFLFNIQKRKRNTEEEPDYISLIPLKDDLTEDELKVWTDTISQVLKTFLRQGDAYTFWNELQILILLQNIQEDMITIIENRILENLNKKSQDKKYDIQIKSAPIKGETSLA